MTATYDTASKKLSWKGTYKDLSGPATAAHFHSGEAGKNGGVAVPIAPATSPLEGSATLTDAQEAELMAGRLYVNVHTAANQGGEIRGQLIEISNRSLRDEARRPPGGLLLLIFLRFTSGRPASYRAHENATRKYPWPATVKAQRRF